MIYAFTKKIKNYVILSEAERSRRICYGLSLALLYFLRAYGNGKQILRLLPDCYRDSAQDDTYFLLQQNIILSTEIFDPAFDFHHHERG